jgi:hypothetical protein
METPPSFQTLGTISTALLPVPSSEDLTRLFPVPP